MRAKPIWRKCKNRGIEPATFNKYRTFVKQRRAYSNARGYALIGQLTVADMDRFYASWKDGKRSKASVTADRILPDLKKKCQL